MDETSLYQKIAAAIRNDILTGRYKPGDRLPTVRKLCEEWNCTPGTIQRAYSELSREGLLVSRAGQGTQVAGNISPAQAQAQDTLRRATLVNRTEAFLLEVLTTGYELDEIQQAMDLAMDRWRALNAREEPDTEKLRFVGSHDMLMNSLAHFYFSQVAKSEKMRLSYAGSLGGLIALAKDEADFAGCHLWDAESDTYNLPYVRRLMPGKSVVVITLVHRRMGLLVAAGNPRGIQGLTDLVRSDVRFVNRQSGSGTRVWLDENLMQMGIDPNLVQGYTDERLTHTDVARRIAEGNADTGLGLESAALAYHLDFVYLNRERYDLVMLTETADQPAVRAFLEWLASDEGKGFVAQHRGYDNSETGITQFSGYV